MWESSNPVLNNDNAFASDFSRNMFGSNAVERPNVTTLQGVVNKTAILVGIAVFAGTIGYTIFQSTPSALWISSIVSMIVCFGIGLFLCGKPKAAPIYAPIYAVTEGVFLGAFTGLADAILKSKNVALAGGVGVQAFIITMAAMVSMLLLYKTGLVRPTQRFRAILGVATGGLFLAYLISFVLSFFWRPLPLISFYGAVSETGPMALIGVGINLFVLGLAAMWLVIDFKQVEDRIADGSPKYMEWYCGFGLLVTLAWIYFEAVKLLVRVAILLGNRK
jgi:uncharacterized YccA/Bax inhibitor family protein